MNVGTRVELEGKQSDTAVAKEHTEEGVAPVPLILVDVGRSGAGAVMISVFDALSCVELGGRCVVQLVVDSELVAVL